MSRSIGLEIAVYFEKNKNLIHRTQTVENCPLYPLWQVRVKNFPIRP